MLVFWALIIIAAVYLIKRSFGHSGGLPASRGHTPLDILKERYAKGEINKQEFEEKKKDLD
jgi:putative membrane protein